MTFEAMFERAAGFRPFPWQLAFATGAEFPEAVIVPTGAGKTEAAALGWLWRRRFAEAGIRERTPRRLVYCLPMRVLVEQTVNRIRAQFDAAGASDVVVHQLMGGHVSRDWIRRPEDDAVIVGTLDQLVSRALMRGYGVSRYAWPIHYALLHNDALWVFDEVQLMGEALATSTQLDGFRRRYPESAGPVRSIWMSATVDPAWLHSVDRPRIGTVLEIGPADHAGGLGARLAATKRLTRIERIDAGGVVSNHRSGSLTLVVVNTVRAARELHRSVVRAKPTAELVLLHSRFRPGDRRDAVGRLEAPIDPVGPGRIVIATQVVEAGVDVSAATLLTEAAPWASLVQRFGRCNRRGEHVDAAVLWAPPEKPAPYDQGDIEASVETLHALAGTSVSPDALAAVVAPMTPPSRRFVIRHRDFIDLFDTASDLSGLDTDIQRFIRDGDDLNVGVAWRDLGGDPPAVSTPDLRSDEICPVPIGEMRDAIKSRSKQSRAWRFDVIDETWGVLVERDLRPGDRILVDIAFGCYTSTAGFDRDAKEPVDPVAGLASEPPEGASSDRERGAWVSIADHSEGVCRHLESLLGQLGSAVSEEETRALRLAARHHDWGKAHEVFQTAMRAEATLPLSIANAYLAKRVGRAPRYIRRGFRHELASALAYLATTDSDGLVTYLIASHHGRVRLGARSLPGEHRSNGGTSSVLGCRDGDELPSVDLGGGTVTAPTTLALLPLELGGDRPYTDLALGLLERLGPYRLSFLEALLRVADGRQSAEEEAGEEVSVGV